MSRSLYSTTRETRRAFAGQAVHTVSSAVRNVVVVVVSWPIPGGEGKL